MTDLEMALRTIRVLEQENQRLIEELDRLRNGEADG